MVKKRGHVHSITDFSLEGGLQVELGAMLSDQLLQKGLHYISYFHRSWYKHTAFRHISYRRGAVV